MDPVFAWIEDSSLSTFIRESPSIFMFPTIITLHVIGVGFLAGTNVAIDLRVLGVARHVPLALMQKFFPVLWLALGVNVVSGTLLLIAYPTKALTNPVFYLKLALIALGLAMLRRIEIKVLHDQPPRQGLPTARILAAGSLLCWAAVVAAGRLLGYTHTWELVGLPAVR